MTRHSFRLIATATLLASFSVLLAHPSGAAAHPLLPPHDPSANFDDASQANLLHDINAARARQEGLSPITFDASAFRALSVPEQVFVMTNIERVTRGLAPAVAMLASLNRAAQLGANRDEDPQAQFSIWSSAPNEPGQEAFFSDYGWMYEDGPAPHYGYFNADCPRAGASGCWGHRNAILNNAAFASAETLYVGAAWNAHTHAGGSVAEAFEYSPSTVTEGVSFTWLQAVTRLRLRSDESGS